MVTPSLVIVGAPNFLSRTTLRPRGPRVTLTVSASLSTPRSRERRASSLNLMILAIGPSRVVHWGCGSGVRPDADRPGTRSDVGSPGRSVKLCASAAERSLLHDGEQ